MSQRRRGKNANVAAVNRARPESVQSHCAAVKEKNLSHQLGSRKVGG